jgi:four helix bundle protein
MSVPATSIPDDRRRAPGGRLDHERLDAWHVAVALDALAVRVAAQTPRGHAWLCDQLLRASGSAVLNLTESVGRSGGDRAHLLRIARGSALEVDGALTLLANRRVCADDVRAEARQLTERLVAMLTGLVARAQR